MLLILKANANMLSGERIRIAGADTAVKCGWLREALCSHLNASPADKGQDYHPSTPQIQKGLV